MRELTLHIGAHKTGTSTVQNWMYNNQRFLKKNSVTPFFIENGKSAVQVNQTYYFDHSKIKNGSVFIKEQLAINLKKCTGKRVVMSSECFSWIHDKEQLEQFKASLGAHFSSIKILIYIRRQDRQALSHYQQRAKSWEAEGHYFKGDNKAFPSLDKNANSYLNYYDHFAMWGDVFGDENITFKVFDRLELKNNCVVSDFLDFLKVPFSQNDINVNDANVSLGILHVKVAHILRSMGVKRNDAIFQKIINELGDSYVMRPARSTAIDFYSNFRASNVALNQRFKISSENESIFSESFDFYNEKASDEWNEDLANHAIKTIIKVILDK
ncbi:MULTISPECIES: hypothetical protein [Pseudoalteromonas]|uniref:hypothetical protein n=1 Tax=Pseudoalteromonas TaxID=53246 RepID=UPI0015F9FD94|nr:MULTISPECIES: hypothetical protein [Pseudoalteromonas]MBB1304065.1 hypothetical protein [Pseudoalteromonas sp. SR43-5]